MNPCCYNSLMRSSVFKRDRNMSERNKVPAMVTTPGPEETWGQETLKLLSHTCA